MAAIVGSLIGLAIGALMLAQALDVRRADRRRSRWPG